MKKLIIYTLLASALAACSSDEPLAPAPEPESDQYEMHFMAITQPLSRAADNIGVYDGETYPVNRLYLTAYLQDSINTRQYYFTDMLLDFDEGESIWKASDWYWPLQGTMSFLSYWCPGFSKAPSFDEIFDVDGNGMPRMTVNGSTLDGQTDFLYLSQTGVKCPQANTTQLVFEHGLTWITVTLRVEVLDDDDEIDDTRSEELINHLTVNKVILEDCSRKGFASIVPGNGVIWKTYCDTETPNISYVRDQVYYRPENFPTPYCSPFHWEEFEDGSEFTPTVSFPKLTMEAQTLGLYGIPTATKIYAGLLIVPQNKTALTVDYTIEDVNGTTIHKVERYELRDNTETWLPGYHYNYDIVFRNYDDYHHNFEVLPSWESMTVGTANPCFGSNAFGCLVSSNNSSSNNNIFIDPVHDGGSGMGDDMDYVEGDRVF